MIYRTNYIEWNPLRGCLRCSDGCNKCNIPNRYGTAKPIKTQLNLPIRRDKGKKYKIPCGTIIKVCNDSDFFIEGYDILRKDMWDIIDERRDCLFHITTRRVGNIEKMLPTNWGNGWSNVMITVSASSQVEADRNITTILDLPIVHRGINISPMRTYINISSYLLTGMIDEVEIHGESYKGLKRDIQGLNIEWIKELNRVCRNYDVSLKFGSTGSLFITEQGKIYIDNKSDEEGLADFYNLSYISKSHGTLNDIANNLEAEYRIEQANRLYTKLIENRLTAKER